MTSPAQGTSPAPAMRDSAVLVAPSDSPNSSPDRTSARVGSRGGSTPSSVDAITDRAVSGRSPMSRLWDTCSPTVR